MGGVITSIQRFSLNDGPGIRTTVFFKGCNLECAWCHNPETFSMGNEIMYYPEKCIGCLHCVPSCPVKAHQSIDGQHVFNRELCTGCGKCAEICFPEALLNTARAVDCNYIMKEVLQDKRYYLDSQGGVTLSGGEVILQSDFAEQIIDECRKNGIECAIETNLAYDLDKFGTVLSKFDLIMFDLKIMDPAEHKKWTGAGNEDILKNIKTIDGYGIPLIARTPLVPGVSDSLDNLKAIVDYLSGMKNLRYHEILNFNPLGEAKFRGLALNNIFADKRPFSDKHMLNLCNKLSGRGVEIKAR